MRTEVLIDAHVHVYDCFDMQAFLNQACLNFEKARRKLNLGQACKFVLALTEGRRENWFETQKARLGNGTVRIGNDWRLSQEAEPAHISAVHGDGDRVHILAGRQIVTAENLEVLALGAISRFSDGLPISEVIQRVDAQMAAAVLPWGAGKWSGRRGRIVRDTAGRKEIQNLLLGDNGNRPWFWPLPTVFKTSGRRNLPGSDPLPFALEARRPGSFGAFLNVEWEEQHPARSVTEALRDNAQKIIPYGRPEGFWRFWRHQIRMQLIKRQR